MESEDRNGRRLHHPHGRAAEEFLRERRQALITASCPNPSCFFPGILAVSNHLNWIASPPGIGVHFNSIAYVKPTACCLGSRAKGVLPLGEYCAMYKGC
jgi:hypothetical protein